MFFLYQVEISDYRNYKKAFQALVLSARCLGQDCRDNAPTEAAKVAVEERIEDIQKRLLLINQFISAQRWLCQNYYNYD